jgi:hypothetical protein
VLGSGSSSLGAEQHHLLNIPNDEKHMLSLCKPLQGKLNIYHLRKKEKQTNNRARVQG